MSAIDFTKNILSDVKVDLSEEFDRNFERKAFFDKAWPATRLINRKGSMMARTNNLRRSIRARQENDRINWSSSLSYASIQNNGGVITVTEKMKSFFWAMYYKSSGAISKNKNGGNTNNDRNKRLSLEAQQWKALALQKVGAKMKIEQRQFIGDHPKARQIIENIVDLNFNELRQHFYNQLKK
ncbi:MAG: phage virion morphogenesis protein [Bacteroidetes bacterium]|nr:phage virion morphogenesis protein [Bacteroidota bacterium]